MWYPKNKKELEKILDYFLKENPNKKIHGVLVPHASYFFSGEIAGKAFCFLKKNKTKKAIIFGPDHNIGFDGIKASDKIKTPFKKTKITKNNFQKIDFEHSIDNQIPFLQKIGFNEVLPLVVGRINQKQAKQIAEKFAKEKSVFVFSTDLSHFLDYKNAVKKDKQTIKAIENLKISELNSEYACGFFVLLILQELCKLKNWKPKLVEYKNSGDIIQDKSSVVGYASFIF